MSRRFLSVVLALLVACDDGGNDAQPEADARVTIDAAITLDIAPEPDAAPEPDIAVPDMAVDAVVVDMAVDSGSDSGPVGELSAGAACDCDDECAAVDGQAGICIRGVCMVEPSEACGGGEVNGCPEGFQCWSLQGGVGPFCWPDCTPIGEENCAGICDGDDSCAPTEDTRCDIECSTYCGGEPPAGEIGTPCEADDDCGGGTCYRAEGWIDGYCLSFGCEEAGAECGEGGLCVSGIADDPVCMGACGPEDQCREGYRCRETDDGKICMAGCADDDACPEGTACVEELCIPDFRCSPTRPINGECPLGQLCREGACVAFECTPDGPLEPNEDQEAALAIDAPVEDLQICADDVDWYRFTPNEVDTIYMLGHASEWGSGNLDVLLKDAEGDIREQAWLLPNGYHDENPRGPMNLEVVSLIGHPDAAEHWLQIFGVNGATNDYDLSYRTAEYLDGPHCEAAGFTRQQCRGISPNGRLTPEEYFVFPAGHAADPYIGDGVFFDSGLSQNNTPGYVPSSARWARREIIMAVRHGIHTVQQTYPGTGPLGVGEISMRDGTTPNGHPNGTHFYGANVDMAYYIKEENQRQWGSIVYRPICSDKANLGDWSDVDTDGHTGNYGECVPGSDETHIVDIPRTALFLATMCNTGRVRVFGVDTSIAVQLKAEYRRLHDEEIISQKAFITCTNAQADADTHGSWVWHFNHSHVSFCAESCPDEKATLSERLRPEYDWTQRLSLPLEPVLQYSPSVIPREMPPR